MANIVNDIDMCVTLPPLEEENEEEVSMSWSEYDSSCCAFSVVRTMSGRRATVLNDAEDLDGSFFELQYDNGEEGIRKLDSLRLIQKKLMEEFCSPEDNQEGSDSDSDDDFPMLSKSIEKTIRQIKCIAELRKRLKGGEIFNSEEFDCLDYGFYIGNEKGGLNVTEETVCELIKKITEKNPNWLTELADDLECIEEVDSDSETKGIVFE